VNSALVAGPRARPGALPAAALTAVLLWPVIAQRLAQRDAATGVPQSWHVRYENGRFGKPAPRRAPEAIRPGGRRQR
jgi:hypothetical protein